MKTAQTETTTIEIQPQNTSDQPSPKQVPPDPTLIWVPISFLTIWAITVLAYLGSLRAKRVSRQPKPKFDLFYAQKIPCRYCKFYSNDPFLKCAVHPKTAMTKHSIDCLDYQGRYVD
jgi:hypothetical protein